MSSNTVKLKVNKLINAYIATTKRFSYAIMLAALTAIIMIIFTHLEDTLNESQTEWFRRAAMALFMGVPLALSIKVYLELISNASRLFAAGIRIAALALLALYFFFGLPNFNNTYIVRYVGYVLFLWGMFLVLPFTKGKPLVEMHTFKVLWRLLITVFYCGIIFGGLSGLLFALKELLNVPIVEEHYLDTLLVVAGIILPSFFFAGIPQKDELLPSSNTKFFRILLIYVLMPLLTAYTVVLYLYFIRMLGEQSLPKNIIGNLVLWYSIVGVMVLYLAKPETYKSKWASIFDKWFPRLLIVPIGMLFTAVVVRINQHGITEARYYIMIGGLWVLAMAVYIILSRPSNRKNAIVPITAALLAVLTVIGPWSAFSVSKLSQNQHLKTLLMENNMLENGVLIANENLDNSKKTQISSRILYFDRNHAISDIDAFTEYESISSIEKELGFELSEWSYVEANYGYYFLREEDYAFDLENEDILFVSRGESITYFTDHGEITVVGKYESNDGQEGQIIVTYNDVPILNKNIAEFGEQLYKKHHDKNELTREEMTFAFKTEHMTIKVVFFNIEVELDAVSASNPRPIGWAEYIILIKLKD